MNNLSRKVIILGGGTNTYISNHLALSAPAYGTTARILANRFKEHPENKMDVELILTKMARIGRFRNNAPDTPEDVEALVDKLVADPDTRVIIFNVAMVDYKPLSLFTEKAVAEGYDQVLLTSDFGKYTQRLSTTKDPYINLELGVQDKIIQKIRKERKDILLVGFKTTCGATKEEQFHKGLKLCKDASANIVFVNDVDKDRIECIDMINQLLKSYEDHIPSLHPAMQIFKQTAKFINIMQEAESAEKEALIKLRDSFQNNGLVTPEESSYWYNTRDEALDGLVQMVLNRVKGEFVRTTVVEGDTVSWNDTIIPQTFKDVFNHIRSNGGWHVNPKGKTSGHYGIKISKYESVCSIRKQNYNDIENVGMVKVVTENDKVIAFGAKPSVGDATQRELFKRYPRYDCIIHFHSSLKITSHSIINIANQFNFECGSTGNSDSCAYNTTENMREYILDDGSRIHAVHLDHHGPNIMFSSRTNPNFINQFISEHWNIDKQTTGLTDEYR